MGGGGAEHGEMCADSSTRQQPDTQQSGLLLPEPPAGSARRSTSCPSSVDSKEESR